MKVVHLCSDWKWTGPAEPAVQLVEGLRREGADARLAELDSLGDAGDPERVPPGLFQRPRHRHGAVPVGVGFDDGQDFPLRADVTADNRQVFFELRERNLRPTGARGHGLPVYPPKSRSFGTQEGGSPLPVFGLLPDYTFSDAPPSAKDALPAEALA